MPRSSPTKVTSVPLCLLQAAKIPTQSLPKMIEIGSKWGPGTLGGRPEARFGPKVEKGRKQREWLEKLPPFLRHVSYCSPKSRHPFLACFFTPSKTQVCTILVKICLNLPTKDCVNFFTKDMALNFLFCVL